MTEAEFQHAVLQAAQLYGWTVGHFRPARTAKGWRTPMAGQPGFPDVTLARDGVVMLRELKTNTGRVSTQQRQWLAALGPHGRVWRPRDWESVIIPELKEGPQP